MHDCLLFIDGDPTTRGIVSYLQSRGFEVLLALKGYEGLRLAYQRRPKAVILEAHLPDANGREVCARLRELSDTPIIVFSTANTPQDIVAGLEAGADDYIAKPCEELELEARLHALLRREKNRESQRASNYDDGRLIIDLQHQLAWRHGLRIHLSSTESRLLTSLLQRRGNVVMHEELLSEVWGSPCIESVHYLSTYIRYLREKLEDDPERPLYIQTKWGRGYRFVPQA